MSRKPGAKSYFQFISTVFSGLEVRVNTNLDKQCLQGHSHTGTENKCPLVQVKENLNVKAHKDVLANYVPSTLWQQLGEDSYLVILVMRSHTFGHLVYAEEGG